MERTRSRLREYLGRLSPPEREQLLAELGYTTDQYLRQMSRGPATPGPRRPVRAEVAARIEAASIKVAKRHGIEPIYRNQICDVCATCPFAQTKES